MTQNDLETQLYKNLEESSTDILIGTAIQIDSMWINTTSSKLIYSFANIEVNTYHKSSSLEYLSYVTVVFPGGTVGSRTHTVFSNPWGELTFKVGEQVKLFTIKDFDIF